MANQGKTSYSFLGANTPEGFYSLFDELIDFENAKDVFILKGGPGTGKSGFMKRCGQDFEKENYSVEYCYCSSDPMSLDAVIIKEKGIAFVDGTAPHARGK